jgi:hypothetical protein
MGGARPGTTVVTGRRFHPSLRRPVGYRASLESTLRDPARAKRAIHPGLPTCGTGHDRGNPIFSAKETAMIETAVLTIFILAMLTLAAGLWGLKTIAAAGFMPETRGGEGKRN